MSTLMLNTGSWEAKRFMGSCPIGNL